MEILKQSQNNPYKVEDQCAIIFAGTNGLIMDVPVDKVKEFESDYLSVLNASHADTLAALKSGKLTDEVVATLTKVTKEVASKYAS